MAGEARWYPWHMSAGPDYQRAHHKIRKYKAAECAHCGTTERLEVALRPDADRSKLLIDEQSGCAYSHDPADYMTLCTPCHKTMDLTRTHCRRAGHEYTPENTAILPGGKRRCKACHREKEAERLLDPEARAQKNAHDREYRKRHPMTAEQKARKIELQRARRASQKGH